MTSCPSTICWKKLLFSLYCFGALVKNLVDVQVWAYFSTLSVPWMCSSIPVPHCLDDCSFIVRLEINSVLLFSALLLKDYFGYFKSFEFPYKFENQTVNILQQQESLLEVWLGFQCIYRSNWGELTSSNVDSSHL